MAAFVGGTVLSKLIKASGGFVMTPSSTKATVPYTALSTNLSATLNNFLGLFSADFFGAGLNDWLAVTAVHVVFACLVVVALFLALRAFGRDFLHGDLIAQLLAVAIVINLLAYCSSTRAAAARFGRSPRSSGSAARWPAECWPSRCCGGAWNRCSPSGRSPRS